MPPFPQSGALWLAHGYAHAAICLINVNVQPRRTRKWLSLSLLALTSLHCGYIDYESTASDEESEALTPTIDPASSAEPEDAAPEESSPLTSEAVVPGRLCSSACPELLRLTPLGTNEADTASGFAALADGSYWTALRTTDPLPLEASETLTGPTASGDEVFLAHYAADGTRQEVWQFGRAKFGLGMRGRSDGKLLLWGRGDGSTPADLGTGQLGGFSFSMLLYDSSTATPLWDRLVDGTDWEIPRKIAFMNSGDALVTGTFRTQLLFEDATSFDIAGGGRPFYAVLDGTDGHRLRSVMPLGDNLATINGISEGPTAGSVLIAGTSNHSVDWGASTISGSASWAFLAAFDASDTYLWHLQVDGPEEDSFVDVAQRGDRIVAVGNCRDEATLEPGGIALGDESSRNALIAVTDNDGNLLWHDRTTGAGDDSYDRAVIHADGSVTAAGVFSGSYELLGTTGGFLGQAFIVVHYDLNGDIAWAFVFETGGGSVSALELSADEATLYLWVNYTGGIDVGGERVIAEGDSDALLIPITLP